ITFLKRQWWAIRKLLHQPREFIDLITSLEYSSIDLELCQQLQRFLQQDDLSIENIEKEIQNSEIIIDLFQWVVTVYNYGITTGFTISPGFVKQWQYRKK